MINSIFKAIFASIIIILAILCGSFIAQIFSFISIGEANIYFAIAGSAIASLFAIDFVKNEVYSEY